MWRDCASERRPRISFAPILDPTTRRMCYISGTVRFSLAHGAAYIFHATAAMSIGASDELLAATGTGGAAKLARAANGASSNRVYAETNDGYYVLGSKSMISVDVLCIFQTAKVLFYLRRWGSKHLLVGKCYMHGVMDEKTFETAKAKGITYFFEIV